ncbi:MAG: substrate-binding domain-containing protein, partial [Hyphomicrobiales bacterium]|nr:substrate-binding domain-containing protein [Hyphomicrobiales bacterium]
IRISTDHGHLLFEQAQSGSLKADIVMLPADMIETLVTGGRALAASRTALGSVNIGAAVRAGSLSVDVADQQTLAEALLKAREIVLTLAPTGEHLLTIIAGLGLMAEVEHKIRRFDKSVQVNEYIAGAPDGALAFGPATEILAWRNKGIAWCGPIPDRFQIILAYEAAVLEVSSNKTAAQDFLEYLTTKDARATFSDTGVAT